MTSVFRGAFQRLFAFIAVSMVSKLMDWDARHRNIASSHIISRHAHVGSVVSWALTRGRPVT